MHEEWTEKYRPGSLQDVVGNNKSIKEVLQWGKDWPNVSHKSLIFHGKPGVGKTSTALALAADLSWDFIEINASDQRTSAVIDKLVGEASSTGTFFGTQGRRLVIIDEADNIHGNYDRGGVRALSKIIKETSQPIILIANDFYQLTPTLRKLCKAYKFSGVHSRTIAKVLRGIAEEEGIFIDEEGLSDIATAVNGDMRSAINDLHGWAPSYNAGERDRPVSIFDFLKAVFKNKNLENALTTYYRLDMTPDTLIMWLVENLPKEYEGEALAYGFDFLSRGDIFLGRVRRRQNYGLWRYASFLIIGGSLGSEYHSRSERGFIRHSAPSTWQTMGRLKAVRGVRDSLCEKVARHCHLSKAKVRLHLLETFTRLAENEDFALGACLSMELDGDELAYLMGVNATDKKVKTIMDKVKNIKKETKKDNIDQYGGFAAFLNKEKGVSKPDPKEDSKKEMKSTVEKEIRNEAPDQDMDQKPQKSLFDF